MIHFKGKRASMIRGFQYEMLKNRSIMEENSEIIQDLKNLPNQNTVVERELAKLNQENLKLQTRNEHLQVLVTDLQNDVNDQASLVKSNGYVKA